MTHKDRISIALFIAGFHFLIGLICIVAFVDYGIVAKTIIGYVIGHLGLLATDWYIWHEWHEAEEDDDTHQNDI